VSIKPGRTSFYVLRIYFQIIYYLYNCALLFSGFIFSISPSNEYSGLMSFCIDWLHLLAVEGTLESLLQQHNLQASIL
jgi:hypothetical protein